MNLLARGIALALVAVWGLPPAVAQEKLAAPYKFAKDEVSKYDVVGDLRISLKGSHKDFIKGGNDEPIKMSYKAQFENVVLEVNPTDGQAKLERRVRTLSAEGMVEGMPFKYEFHRAKDLGKPAGAFEGPGTVAGLFREWCTKPLQFAVTADGKYSCSTPNYDQLVNKAGAMYWFVSTDSKPWLTEERIAAPLLHNKVIIEFKNEFTRTRMDGHRKLMVIGATPSVKGTEEPPPGAPRIAEGPIEFKVTAGRSEVQFDTTNHRLHSVSLDLKIRLNGKGPVTDGSMGDIKGDVSFTEDQRYTEK